MRWKSTICCAGSSLRRCSSSSDWRAVSLSAAPRVSAMSRQNAALSMRACPGVAFGVEVLVDAVGAGTLLGPSPERTPSTYAPSATTARASRPVISFMPDRPYGARDGLQPQGPFARSRVALGRWERQCGGEERASAGRAVNVEPAAERGHAVVHAQET